MLEKIRNLNRSSKVCLVIFCDFLALSVSIYISFCAYNSRILPFTLGPQLTLILNFFIFLIFSKYFNIYSIIFRYFNYYDIFNLLKALFLQHLFLFISSFFFKINFFFLNLSFLMNQFGIFLFLLITSRLIIKKLNDNTTNKGIIKKPKSFIYGAGHAGITFHNLANSKEDFVGYIDDDISKINAKINNKKIFSYNDFCLFLKTNKIDKVYICMPSISSVRLFRVIKKITELKINYKIISGESYKYIDEIGIVEITKDKLKTSKVANSIYKNKTILITGAAGTIGKELAYQIGNHSPKKIILLDNNENGISNLHLDFNSISVIKSKFEIKLLNLCDLKNLEVFFKKTKIDFVFHAAAYKHISIMENNPQIASYNNIFSTINIIIMSKKYNVKKLIFISSDKAVYPINILGFCKRIGEKIIKHLHSDKLKMTSVRFGNVIASSGSLIPKIQEQIKYKKIIFLTDKNATRYFMTIRDAVNLIISSSQMKMTGDVLVLDMGTPIKIYDIAKAVLKSKNLIERKNNLGDIKIKYTGLQKGEKLHEKLYYKKFLIHSDNNQIKKERVFLGEKENNYLKKIYKVFNISGGLSDNDFKEKLKTLL